MKMWQRVKEWETRNKKESWRLPDHDRTRYIWYKLPYRYNRFRNHNFVFALTYLIGKSVKRFKKVYGMRIEFSQKVIGEVGSHNHAMKITIKIYFKD